MKWQERYARWMLKPKPPRRLNEALNHWWFFAGVGLLAAAIMILQIGPIENPLQTQPDITTYEDLNELWANLGFYVAKLMACVIAWLFFLFFTITGLITEERKGYKMIIERLEANAEARETS